MQRLYDLLFKPADTNEEVKGETGKEGKKVCQKD